VASCDGNDLGGDGGSSRSQAADVCTDGDRAATGLCDCVTPTPNTTAVNQNVTWSGTLTALNGYSGSVTLSCTAGARNVRDCAGFGDADGWRNCFYGDARQRSAGTFTFTIQATDGTLTHATPPETLTVTGASTDFT